MERKSKIYVKVYFNEKDFTTIAEQSVKVGKRKGGLQLFTQKPHGFAHEKVANTKGISKFLKMCAKYYMDKENERAKERIELEIQKKELERKEKQLKDMGI
jgi:hypothetical protein